MTKLCIKCHTPVDQQLYFCVCEHCLEGLRERGNTRQERIEARFERLVERNCDVGAMAWDFDCLWILAEQAEDFLDGKRGK